MQLFNSKILLFGEYLLMTGGKALTVPFHFFSARLGFGQHTDYGWEESNKSISLFFDYLFSRKKELPEGLEFDFEKLKTDLENKLFLSSDIPQGYGVGSSGVLVASVYAAYAVNPLDPLNTTNMKVLKEYFSFMESFFHGKSSGLDPLSCYTGKPLNVSSPENISIVDSTSYRNIQKLNVFLIDTGLTSRTEGLVQIFLAKSKTQLYRNALDNQIIPANNACINLALNGKTDEFQKQIGLFSKMQLEYFPEMIPQNLREIWESGNGSGEFFLKLCGSGGGGFILGFTPDYQKAEKLILSAGMKILPVYKNN